MELGSWHKIKSTHLAFLGLIFLVGKTGVAMIPPWGWGIRALTSYRKFRIMSPSSAPKRLLLPPQARWERAVGLLLLSAFSFELRASSWLKGRIGLLRPVVTTAYSNVAFSCHFRAASGSPMCSVMSEGPASEPAPSRCGCSRDAADSLQAERPALGRSPCRRRNQLSRWKRSGVIKSLNMLFWETQKSKIYHFRIGNAFLSHRKQRRQEETDKSDHSTHFKVLCKKRHRKFKRQAMGQDCNINEKSRRIDTQNFKKQIIYIKRKKQTGHKIWTGNAWKRKKKVNKYRIRW